MRAVDAAHLAPLALRADGLTRVQGVATDEALQHAAFVHLAAGIERDAVLARAGIRTGSTDESVWSQATLVVVRLSREAAARPEMPAPITATVFMRCPPYQGAVLHVKHLSMTKT